MSQLVEKLQRAVEGVKEEVQRFFEEPGLPPVNRDEVRPNPVGDIDPEKIGPGKMMVLMELMRHLK